MTIEYSDVSIHSLLPSADPASPTQYRQRQSSNSSNTSLPSDSPNDERNDEVQLSTAVLELVTLSIKRTQFPSSLVRFGSVGSFQCSLILALDRRGGVSRAALWCQHEHGLRP